MGHFDRKNYIVVVKLKESCSDTRIINWQLEREFSYTVAEVNNFQSSIAPHHNPLAEKIVCFFSEYSNGVLLPNKWNTFEPIKHDYKASELNRYVAILAYPCGNLFLKNKKITCHIENCDFGFWWFDGKPCSPKISFDYLVEIRIFFSKQSKPKMDFMHKLADDMAKYFNTDYSKIIDQELTII